MYIMMVNKSFAIFQKNQKIHEEVKPLRCNISLNVVQIDPLIWQSPTFMTEKIHLHAVFEPIKNTGDESNGFLLVISLFFLH